ncbi:unnamed protein product, partial [Prorocentrum cordatum]
VQRVIEARSQGSDVGSANGSCSSPATFIPQYFNIDNFSTNDDRKSKGISRFEAQPFVDNLVAKLPDLLKPKVKDFEIFGPRSNRVRVYVVPPYATEIALNFRDFLADPELYYKGRQLWTVVQKSPEEQARYEKIGKAKAFLDEKLKSNNANAYAECSYSPYWILYAVNGDTEVEMGTIDSKGDVAWNDVNTGAAFGLDGEGMTQ